MKIFFCNFSKSLLVSAANNLLCWPVHNAETLVEVYLNNQRFYLFHASTYFHERTSLLRIRIFFKQTRLYTILIQFYTLQFLSYLNTNPTSFFSFLLLGFIWLHGIFEGHADIAGRGDNQNLLKKNIPWMSADESQENLMKFSSHDGGYLGVGMWLRVSGSLEMRRYWCSCYF